MLDSFSPLTPLGFTVMFLRDRRARARTAAEHRDLGASAVEWVVITVVTVALIAIVSVAITTAVKNKAGKIDLNGADPAGP